MEDKAKQRARDSCYGTDPLNRAEYTANEVRDAFIDGYNEAEKDLELTCEDIELIVNIDKDTDNEESIIGVRNNKEHYQEVLKRFIDFKERKEK